MAPQRELPARPFPKPLDPFISPALSRAVDVMTSKELRPHSNPPTTFQKSTAAYYVYWCSSEKNKFIDLRVERRKSYESVELCIESEVVPIPMI